MHSASSVHRAEARFRQMCCLSVNGRLLAPMLFRELHSVLPFASCLYMWLGDAGPVDAYFNIPEVGQYLPLYAEEHFRRAEASVWATTDEAAASQFGPHMLEQVLRISRPAYFRHPLYNEIMKPSNVHSFIRLLIRDKGQRPVGTFTIGRGPQDREFDEADRATLHRFEPLICHAFDACKEGLSGDTVEDESALIIVDASGRIQSLSPSARALLPLSQGSTLAPVAVHEGLLQALRTLVNMDLARGRAAAPEWSTTNQWGRFTARAYWMEETGSPRTTIGIFLARRIPRDLKILAGLHRFSLPSRQEQVALLLALGRSEEQAARELGISRNTLVYHRRQVYNRLDVESRKSLMACLLNGGP